MKRIYRFITSMPFMAFILMVLAFSMAVATFTESSRGTAAARSLIYNARWFEILWALFALNLVNNIIKYKLYLRKRFTIGIFHVAFLVILSGAAVTRYFSFEGTMHIREQGSSDYILSADDYVYAGIGDHMVEREIKFSEYGKRRFSEEFNINGQVIKVQSSGFISGAERKAVPSPSGIPVIDLVFISASQKGMQSVLLSDGDLLENSGISIGFATYENTGILFFTEGENLYMTSKDTIAESTMGRDEMTEFGPGDTITIKSMFLYNSGDFRFLVRKFYPGAELTAVKSNVETNEDAVIIRVSGDVDEKTVPVFGHSGMMADTVEVQVGGDILKLAWGARHIQVPFRVRLNDFILERYPGSDSPSSFASDITIIDEGQGLEEDLTISMNKPVLFKGYKFFQSSYDTDEKGTILSVNHDFTGALITYVGYALLILGMLLSLINRYSYFRILVRRLKKIKTKITVTVILVLGISTISAAQTGTAAGIPPIESQVVKSFSELWVQGVDGRIEPVSTLNGEIVRKISRKSSLFGRSPDEVVLSMMAFPDIWRSMPVIRVSNKALASRLQIQGKYISIDQLIDNQGNYKIAEDVKNAYNKNPVFRNRLDKEYIYLDEKISICFMVFRGSVFHIFPSERKENKWYAPGMEATEYSGSDSVFIKNGFNVLVNSIIQKNSEESLSIIEAIDNFQNCYGGDLLPAETKKSVEIFYNKANPFERIFPFYLMTGFLLLFILFVNIFRSENLPGYFNRTLLIVGIIIFSIHTAGLIMRWYIAGHAPWSNGYESIVYVAWASMLAGLLFGRKYPMVVGTAAFLSGVSLFVAHLSWMNPEITNLVPVLKSYWLTVHVSVITSSYGFIGLSAFLGVLVLILIVIRKKQNEQTVNEIIDQLTAINEMSVIAGLYFLTAGTLFGA
ncbi:MAG: cytochrome c biogenesis protein ResB, partial [Prolixibacteraceae bacterium]|nr:cytochrome c biogenesis protein ResB [Prolixibacteraceae bacterium]